MADANERANDNKKDRLTAKLQRSNMQEKEVGDVVDARSSAMESLNAELKKHTVSIEKQTEDVSKQNNILADQIKSLDSSKNIFSNVFETFNPLMAWKYMKLKNKLLDKMSTAVENVEIDDLENDIKVTDLLGDSPNQSILFSIQYAKIRSKLLKKIDSAVKSMDIEDSKPGDVLNKVLDAPKDNKFFNLQYFLFRRSLLSKITKALPKKFNEVSPDFVQEKVSESLDVPKFEMPKPEILENGTDEIKSSIDAEPLEVQAPKSEIIEPEPLEVPKAEIIEPEPLEVPKVEFADTEPLEVPKVEFADTEPLEVPKVEFADTEPLEVPKAEIIEPEPLEVQVPKAEIIEPEPLEVQVPKAEIIEPEPLEVPKAEIIEPEPLEVQVPKAEIIEPEPLEVPKVEFADTEPLEVPKAEIIEPEPLEVQVPKAEIIGPENTILQSESRKNNEPMLSLLREINENVFLIKENVSDALLKPTDDKKSILEEKARMREEQKHEDLISTLKGISVEDSGAAVEDKGGGFIRTVLEKAFGIKTAAGAAALGGGVLVKIAAVGKAISATVVGIFATISKSLMVLGAGISKTVLMISKSISASLVMLGKGVGLAIASVLGGLAKGLLLLSNPKLLLGVAVLAGLGGAIFIAGKAFQQFSEINWRSVGIGLATLVGVGAVAAALSLAAPVFLIGAGVIAALGAALIPFATAALIFSRAAGPLSAAIDTIIGSMGDFIVKIGDTISKIFDSITNSIQGLADVKGSELTDTANGLIALSGALVAYAAGGTLAGVADGIRRLFGVDMVTQLVRLGETGPALELAAHSLDRIGIAFKRIRLHSGKDTIKSIEAMTKALISNQNALSKSDGQGEFFKFALAFKGIADNSDKLISVFESGYKFLLEANKFKSFAINNLELTTPSELNAVNVGSQIYDEKERQPSQAEQIGRAVSESTNNIMTNLSETMTTVSAGGNVTSNYYQNTNIDYTQEKSVAGNMW